jgi:hypothetical protein
MSNEITSKFDEKIFIINGSEIEEMTYGEYCREYGADETTSPRGIAPRMHIRDKSEFGATEEDAIFLFEIWSWGTGGNNPYFTGTSFDNEADADNEIMEIFEYNAMNKNDNAPSYYSTEEEAVAAWAEMEGVSTYSVVRFLKVKEYRKAQAKIAAEKYAEEKVAKNLEEETEANSIVIDEQFANEILVARQLPKSGNEKHNAMNKAMQGLLARLSFGKIKTDYWKVFRIVSGRVK